MKKLFDTDNLVIAESESFTLKNGVWVSAEGKRYADRSYTCASFLIDVPNFKLLFTGSERVAIKNSTDDLVIDFYDMLQDQRVQNIDASLPSIHEALGYLELSGVIAEGRAQEIIEGCRS